MELCSFAFENKSNKNHMVAALRQSDKKMSTDECHSSSVIGGRHVVGWLVGRWMWSAGWLVGIWSVALLLAR
jgi:hypothetical protein